MYRKKKGPVQLMGKIKSLESAVRMLTEADPSYAGDAYFFVRDTVTYAQSKQEVHRHMSAAELVTALLELAGREFGPLARPVLAEWGVTCPADVGRIVYKLIDAGILSASPEDRPEDFQMIRNWFPDDELMTEYVSNIPLPKIDG